MFVYDEIIETGGNEQIAGNGTCDSERELGTLYLDDLILKVSFHGSKINAVEKQQKREGGDQRSDNIHIYNTVYYFIVSKS